MNRNRFFGLVGIILLGALGYMMVNDASSASYSAQSVQANVTQAVGTGATALGLLIVLLIVASLIMSVMSMFRRP
jgi:uncharacterized membrane protein YhaH (DUF805 family)